MPDAAASVIQNKLDTLRAAVQKAGGTWAVPDTVYADINVKIKGSGDPISRQWKMTVNWPRLRIEVTGGADEAVTITNVSTAKRAILTVAQLVQLLVTASQR